jgi:hypothetical protein
MKNLPSRIVFGLSCLSALITLLLIPGLVHAVRVDSEGWGSMIFRMLVAPMLGGATLLLAVLPSVIIYRRSSHRLDLASLVISSITLGLIILAWFMVEPLRQSIIFGK